MDERWVRPVSRSNLHLIDMLDLCPILQNSSSFQWFIRISFFKDVFLNGFHVEDAFVRETNESRECFPSDTSINWRFGEWGELSSNIVGRVGVSQDENML